MSRLGSPIFPVVATIDSVVINNQRDPESTDKKLNF